MKTHQAFDTNLNASKTMTNPYETKKNRKTISAFTLTTIAVALALSGLLSACGKSADTKAPAVAAAAAPKAVADPMLVSIKPDMAKNFAVTALQPVDVATIQEISGRIDANERLVARIGAAVTGRVTEVLVEVGDRVRSGQTLARIASPELTNAQLAYLRASSAASLANRGVERARQLIQADVIGTAELQRRESEVAIALAEQRAAADQLRLLGMPSDALEKLREQGSLAAGANVSATLSGVVIERKVSQGQVAQPGEPLFTVADLSNVWVIGALPEQAARTVALGQRVDVTVPALGEQKLSGKVVFISDTISPDTRAVTIRTQVDNPNRSLKPQMLATLSIKGAPSKQLTVPTDAVVRENDKDHVFVKTGDNRYRLTPVELGAATDGIRPILKGPASGTSVVTSGAFHLNNERKRSQLEE